MKKKLMLYALGVSIIAAKTHLNYTLLLLPCKIAFLLVSYTHFTGLITA